MSSKYPERCPHCSADTRVRADLWSSAKVADHGIYQCGTNIRDAEDLRRGFPEDDVRGVGKYCFQRQLNDAIAAVEQAIPIVVAHQRHTSEGEHTLNLMRFVVDRYNANLH